MTSVLVIGILGILIAVFVAAPLMSRSAPTKSAVAHRATRQEGRRSRAGVTAAASRSRLPPPPASGGGDFVDAAQDGATIDELIDIDRIEGQVKASSVKKVDKIVGMHPDEALAVVRSWMNGDR